MQRLALYAPVWVVNPTISTVPKLPAYRAVQRQMAHDRWLREVPEDKKANLIPAGVFDMWWSATIASDPVGAANSPPALRAPNGVLYDLFNYWSLGKAMYDPAKISVPTILEQISPGLNRYFPGWFVSENLAALIRFLEADRCRSHVLWSCASE